MIIAFGAFEFVVSKYDDGFGTIRERTNVQQLTCKIDSSNSFYYLFFSFIILELKPLVLKGKVRGKNYEKVPKSAKKCEKL